MQLGSSFFYPLFLVALLGLLLAIVVIKNRSTPATRIFAFFSFVISAWTFGLGMFGVVSKDEAYFWNQEFILAASLIAAAFLHFIYAYSREKIQSWKIFVLYAPSALVGIILFFWPEKFIKGIVQHNWGKESLLGDFYICFGAYYTSYTTYGFYKLYNKMCHLEGLERKRYQFILIATCLTSCFGAYFNLFLILIGNYKYVWVGPYCLLIIVSVISYAIVKYRLMDIKLVFTRAGIFLFIYSLILGIPIWFGFKILGDGLWLLPISLMGILAILGPFIYFFIQKQAEDRLLQEQKSYQSTLRQASAGMGRIKELDKLLYMIVYVLTRTVRIEYAVIYIHDELKNVYKLGAFKHRNSSFSFRQNIPEKHPLIEYLTTNRASVIHEELKQKIQDQQDSKLHSIEILLSELGAELVVPIYINNRLIAFVGMGKKESGKHYSDDDLSVFSILANQVALAIENAQFYEDMKVTQEQLFQAEKMATIGIMADGLSHQINNRFHAMGFIAGDALDTIKMNKNLEMSDQLKEIMAELERALNRVQDNVTQGGEVVQGLLKYTRKGDAGFSPTDVDAVISSAYEMAQFKIKSYQMSLVRGYDKDALPKVKGNSTQLQEVFFNLIDNAYDAMMQRKTDLKESDYHPTLTITAKVEGKELKMIFEDNGAGVKEEDVQKLFTPFFTTKLSSKKGTGLGLYVIRKIIEDNHKGKVEFVSRFMIGTQMIIRLPIAAQ